MTAKKRCGLVLATAAAALFASGTVLAGEKAKEEAKVHCGGINACKGQTDCKTATNACKGQNTCKGQGYKDVTKEECEAKGGKVLEG
ncbi:MAG: hypothetical protein M3255_05405 [Pseudomonadota bacterium]|nr:hypothetical protein [Pseudomonadota bacterium]